LKKNFSFATLRQKLGEIMPELRKDPITGNWIVVATERAKRPELFGQNKKKVTVCPFCPGNEAMTPPEIMAYRTPKTKANEPGWKLRVVPNKFPAFIPDERAEITNGLFTHMPAVGAHEVIIHSPAHTKSLGLMSLEEIELVIKAYIERYLALKEKKYIQYISIILNHGEEAGASIEHPHSQIFASPIIPPKIERELNRAAVYYKKNHHCLFCDILEAELSRKIRLIKELPRLVAFIPYASGLPFQVTILPKSHNSAFEKLDSNEKKELALILKILLLQFQKAFSDPPYNLYLHTSPCNQEDTSYYHWHITLFPKLTVQAGFESSTGILINITQPEEAAVFLRDIKVTVD
jgi:UDPglucose--hexose-1-phosphate uridylyltransferase